MISGVMDKTVKFNLVVLLSTLRHMRVVRDNIKRDLHELEERMRAGHDGVLGQAHRVLDAELAIVEESVRLMQEAYVTKPTV